jgi:tRNA 5-methylaminomethyl-2-thiouridine biosynthesis bifunctional protein
VYFLKKRLQRSLLKYNCRDRHEKIIIKEETQMQKTQINLNPHYQDCYFSDTDGQAEAHYIFIEGNDLPRRLNEEEGLHIGETGFGTGLNLLCLMKSFSTVVSKKISVKYSSLEKYPLSSERIKELLSPFEDSLGSNFALFLDYWKPFYDTLTPGWNQCTWDFPKVQLDFSLYVGDAGDWSQQKNPKQVDAWFLDGHSPEKNPDIWAPSVMQSVYEKTAPGGTLASFTASGVVKRPLREAGFFIKRKKGFGTKRHMIQGFKT